MLPVKKLLVCALLMLSFSFCYGQNSNTYIQRTVESLDQITPVAFKKVKPQGCAYTIKVANQEQFDAINTEISKAIKAGKKNIQVRINPGVYQFRQELIRRKNELTDVSISFVGNNAVITSDKNYRTTGGKGSGWHEMVYADSIIQVVDEKNKLCLIPYANKMNESEKKNLTKVQITQWFRARTYDIKRVDQKGIYFIAPELVWENGYGHKGYNVNFDYLYLGKIPRFRVFDDSQEPDCSAARFLTMENCSYHSLTFKGIKFESADKGNILLHFTSVNAKQIVINRCEFNYIRGNGVGFFCNTGNVVFDRNSVSNTGGDELFFTNNCQNIRITNNTFKNCGQNISNSFCVRCYEADYYIADNTFLDFGYGAIGVGVWHGFDKKYYSGGIIEHNEIYFTPNYFAEAWKHMLMDSGAIYTWTQNDHVIIRYNYIRDYTGAGHNRGIFCDDGANNLKIYGNVILNTPNCYSIDSRMAKDKREGFTNNANNFMANNVVDNGVRFQGHADVQRHVVKGANLVVKSGSKDAIKDIFDNLEHIEEDMVITNAKSRIIRKQIRKCTHR